MLKTALCCQTLKELLPFGLFIFIVCKRIIFIWKSIQINAIWFQSARKADVMYMVMQLDLLFGGLRLGYYFSHCHFMSSVDGASSQLSSVNRLHACTAHVRVCVKSDKNNASEQNKKKNHSLLLHFMFRIRISVVATELRTQPEEERKS